MIKKFYLLLFSFIIVIVSCNNSKQADAVSNPPGYDLSKPEKYIMPDVLLEISGIAFKNANADTLYAQQDEEGKVFALVPGQKKNRETRFSKRGDYEDIAIGNGYVFLLRSDGTILGFREAELQSDLAGNVKEWEGLLPGGEFEGMYADTGRHLLYILCKQCSEDKGSNMVSGYTLHLSEDSMLVRDSTFSINADLIFEKTEKKKGKKQRFQPSALARHPKTGDWFILSSVNKLLVVATAQWGVKGAYPLDPARFRQPEGIAFDKDGNLFISNEGDEISNGNVLRFAYHSQP
ncbi:MAG: SdiA-regulated family protein [Chitinophagaceae bacterium]|nr:SdiA-regulated family protein [Chitinophagaceae bacterium]